MKSIMVFLFLVSPACLIEAQVSSKGMMVHYNFNLDLNKDKTRLYDQSRNDNHGLIKGAVKYSEDRHGNGCSALHFNGNSYATVPNSRSLSSPKDALTIAVWFKINDGADFFNQWITICCKSNLTEETDYSPQYRMQATAQTVSLNTEFTEEVIPQLAYDTWYFYAYIFDGYKVKVYLDSQYVFEYPYYGELQENNLPLEIGRDLPGKLEYFYGVMDDLRIYNKELSEKELSQLYQDASDDIDTNRCEPVVVDVDTISKGPDPKNVNPNDNTQASDFPSTLLNVPVDYQETVKVKSKDVIIYPFDNGVEDGDTVSLYVNGKWILEKYRILNKSYNPSERPELKVKLNPSGPNYLISKAWNEGRIRPNTLTIEISDGKTSQIITINSKMGESGAIKIEVGG